MLFKLSEINNRDTRPKIDARFDLELWNEDSVIVPWFLGVLNWACLINVGEFVLTQGFFSLGVAVARLRNIPGVSDLTNLNQLKHALFYLLTPKIKANQFQPIIACSASISL